MPKFKMKLLFTNIIFLLTTNLWGQTELGVGLVSINLSDTTVLQFYSAFEDKQPSKTIEIFNDKTINSWNILNLDKQKQWLNPECLWLDYSSLIFRCKSQTNNWYELIVNNDNGQTLWLKKNTLSKFSTWDEFLIGMLGVARLADKKQIIRTLPNDNAKEINYTGRDCFKVKSMKDDWIEIFTADYCDDLDTISKTKVKSGWIKWRKENTLLIQYFLTS
jgi:hypothetical protein